MMKQFQSYFVLACLSLLTAACNETTSSLTSFMAPAIRTVPGGIEITPQTFNLGGKGGESVFKSVKVTVRPEKGDVFSQTVAPGQALKILQQGAFSAQLEYLSNNGNRIFAFEQKFAESDSATVDIVIGRLVITPNAPSVCECTAEGVDLATPADCTGNRYFDWSPGGTSIRKVIVTNPATGTSASVVLRMDAAGDVEALAGGAQTCLSSSGICVGADGQTLIYDQGGLFFTIHVSTVGGLVPVGTIADRRVSALCPAAYTVTAQDLNCNAPN